MKKIICIVLIVSIAAVGCMNSKGVKPNIGQMSLSEFESEIDRLEKKLSETDKNLLILEQGAYGIDFLEELLARNGVELPKLLIFDKAKIYLAKMVKSHLLKKKNDLVAQLNLLRLKRLEAKS